MKRTKFHAIQPGAQVDWLSRRQGRVRDVIGQGCNRLIYVKFADEKHFISAVQEIDLILIK